MLIVDIGSFSGKESPLVYAEDENNLVYVVVPQPSQTREVEAQSRHNLRVFCFSLGEDDASDRPSPAMDLATFMAQNHIVDVDLLRVGRDCAILPILKGAGDRLHAIKKVRLDLPMPDSDKGLSAGAISYLETAGFRVVSRQTDPNDPGEIVELIRVNRYARRQDEAAVYIVDVPHLGPVETPPGDLVGRLLEQGLFEGPEQAFLWLYLRPGDTFFDCGAHVGVLSCLAAKKLQGKGRIVGFEPLGSNAVLYQNNLSRCGSDCFEVMQVGLSDQPGKAPFFLGKTGLSAYSTFAPGAQTHDQIGGEHIVVEQTTLDRVMAAGAFGTVTLSKLDVEGWEVPVLRGAAQSIAQGKFPLWMIEFTEENAIAAGSSTAALADLLEDLGYTLCRFDATRLCLVVETRRLSYAYANLFAVADIDQVNGRLAMASAADRAVARAIVDRWDTAQHLQTIEMLLGVCEQDRADRLDALIRCEQDRADRLDALTRCEQDRADWLDALTRCEQDRADWLDALTRCEQDRADWLDALTRCEQDQAAHLDVIEKQADQIAQDEKLLPLPLLLTARLRQVWRSAIGLLGNRSE